MAYAVSRSGGFPCFKDVTSRSSEYVNNMQAVQFKLATFVVRKSLKSSLT